MHGGYGPRVQHLCQRLFCSYETDNWIPLCAPIAAKALNTQAGMRDNGARGMNMHQFGNASRGAPLALELNAVPTGPTLAKWRIGQFGLLPAIFQEAGGEDRPARNDSGA